jgi:phage-related protein
MAYYEPAESLNQGLQAQENEQVNRALTRYPTPYLSGLKLNEDVTIGSLVLNRLDRDTGVVWVCTDITGWWDLPEPKFADLTRGWGDGSYDADGRYESRVMTLTGSVLVPEPSAVPAARQALVEAFDLVYKGAQLIVEEDPIKTSYVRLSGRPLIRNVNARGRLDFSVGLKAADPIKYEYLENTYRTASITESTPAIYNLGNTRTPVIFELGGIITSGTITNTYTSPYTGQSVTETMGGITKDFAGTLEIDTYNRNMLKVVSEEQTELGRQYADTLIDWIYLYPGENTLEFAATGTSPSCTMYYRSGWIG